MATSADLVRSILSVGGDGGDARLQAALQEYCASVDEGNTPVREAFLAKYPEVEAQLAGCLDALDFMSCIAPACHRSQGSPPRQSAPISPLITLGDYRIVRELGRGGMGVVYEAQQLSLGRRVALKVLPFAALADSQALQRFQNEARAAATLHHPHIVPVFSVGSERGVHYYSMQFIDGPTLATVLQELSRNVQADGPTADGNAIHDAPTSDYQANAATRILTGPPSETWRQLQADLSTQRTSQRASYFRTVARWGVDAAEALAYAHDHGVVHRDIKPSNLLLDDKGHLWVTDFGLARLENDASITITGAILGTLRYMAPEQALGKRVPIDHRVDVYALGATLYEMLTLTPAYPGEDREELLRQIASEQPRPPRRVDATLPVELETIVLKAMEKSRDDRYALAAELADDLQRFLDHRPIVARPPSLLDRWTKWARRHVALVTSAAVVSFVLMTAAIASSILIWRANKSAKAQAILAQKNFARASQLADRNQQVLDAFVAAFQDPNPMNEDFAGEMSARQVLERALARLEDQNLDDPLTQAMLLEAIGSSLLQLGAFDQAIPALEHSRDLRTTTLGADHADTLQSATNLANAYRLGGRLPESIQLLQEEFDRNRTQQGLDQLETLESIDSLATALLDAGRIPDAISLLEEALPAAKQTAGEVHTNLTHSLATAYLAANRRDEALPLFNQVYPVIKSQLGPDHPNVLTVMNNIASVYSAAGRLDEALAVFEEATRLSKGRLGPDHPLTLNLMNNLASTYETLDRTDEAITLGEETTQRMKATLGEDHLYTLCAASNLARAYLSAQRVEDAIALFEETLQRMESSLPEAHPFKINTMRQLAAAYTRSGRLEQAIELSERSMEMMKATLGPEHVLTLSSMQAAATAYQSAGRLEEAIPLYEAALQSAIEQLGADYWGTLELFFGLQRALLQDRQFARAETVVRQWIDTLQDMQEPPRNQLARATTSLAEALSGQGKHSEAREKIDAALRMEELPAVERWRASSIEGALLGAAHQWDAAEPQLIESFQALEQQVSQPWLRWYVPRACERIVTMYEDWEKPDEAAQWRVELERVEQMNR